MAAEKAKPVWKRETVQTALMIILIIAVVAGLWFGSQAVLGTQYPALAVASGSMCKVQYMACDGWSHPFGRTLHFGDLIIVKGVTGAEVVTGYDPNGDIIIFHKPNPNPSAPDELIVHRAIYSTVHNGLRYFRTKGDGSSGSGDIWSSDYRGEDYSWDGMISEKLLVGKVVMRVPWIGHLALFMRNSTGIYIIVALIALLVIVEFIIPELRKKPETEAETEKPEAHSGSQDQDQPQSNQQTRLEFKRFSR